MKIRIKKSLFFSTLTFCTVSAHAVMNGLGQDIFPVAAVFNSSITVHDARGAGAAQVRMSENVVVSSETSAALGGGVRVSTNVYIVGYSSAAKYYGDGSALTGITGSAGVPSGAVMFFNLASCPSGWTALAAAQGRYLIGLPSGGSLAGTVGTALTDLENRPVGIHSHGVTDPGHAHWNTASGGTTDFGYKRLPPLNEDWNPTPDHPATTGISINNSGTVAGTNAPYLQLLVCQKD